MRRRSRGQRVLKWCGLVLCLLAFGLWVVSVRTENWMARDGKMVGVHSGCIYASAHKLTGEPADIARAKPVFQEFLNFTWRESRETYRSMQASQRERGIMPPKMSLKDYGFVWPEATVDDYTRNFFGVPGPYHHKAPPVVKWTATVVVSPCWVLLLLTIVPTALLWWRDRRFPRGHCQRCCYDLTGNVSGRCPECGTIAEPEEE